MEDSQFPFPSNGPADDENRRHNNLRRDILTSLLEVDQSIKGLEHHLVGRIQQIEDKMPSQEPVVGTDAARPCEFDPAATTAWALRIIQENLAPLTSGLSAIQTSLQGMKGGGGEGTEGLLDLMTEEVVPLRDTLKSLRGEIERIRGTLAELKEASSPLQERSEKTLRETESISGALAGLGEKIEDVQANLAHSQESEAPLAEDLVQLKESILDLRDHLGSLRDSMEGTAQRLLAESRQSLTPLQEEVRRLSEAARAAQEILSGLKEALFPLREASERAADSARDASEGILSLREELRSLRAAFEESQKSSPLVQAELRQIREAAQGLDDRLSGLKEAVGPLRDLASRAAESAQAGAAGVAGLHQEMRALPGALRSDREALAATVGKDSQEHSQLLREIGGKVMEELSLVLAEVRRTSAQGPEAFAGFTQEISTVRAAQKESTKVLTRLGDLLEQNPQAELTLSALQQIQERNEATGAGLVMLLDMVKRGDDVLKRMQESHAQVIQAFQSHRQTAREEDDRIRQRQAQESNNRGVVLYYRGALEPAEASFRKAIEVDPRYAEAWNNLGLVRSRLGKAEDAAAAFEKAIEIDPKMGEVYNNLGFLYHTSLQYDRALEMFNQALQTTSDSAVAYTNLGNTYYKLNRHEQAVQAWKRALELDPLNENARRCLRMYQQENA